jgi:alcohol dehydrogenase class IV
MFLPAVVRFNAHAESVQRDRRMQRMAFAMGLGDVGVADASAKSSMEAAEAVAQAITAMNARLGLPKGLAEMGVDRAWFDKIIEGAMADHCHKTNPRIATAQEYREMLESAM